MGTIRTNYDVYLRDFRDCPVFTSKVFGKNRRRHLIPGNRPLPPVETAIRPHIVVSRALKRLPKPDEHSNDP